MRPSLKALVAVTAALALSSCSASEDKPASASSPTPVETAAVTATPKATSTPQPTTMEETYLEQLRETHPSLATASDDSLVGVGKGVCDLYDKGNSTNDINDFLAIGAGVAYTFEELAAMHGGAVGAFCPQHVDTLRGSMQK